MKAIGQFSGMDAVSGQMSAEIGQIDENVEPAGAWPIMVCAYRVGKPGRDGLHDHGCHQLTYCEQAGTRLSLGSQSTEIPEDGAIMVPRGVCHALEASTHRVVRCVYFKGVLPNARAVPVALNRLTKELIVEMSCPKLEDRARRAMAVCLYDQIGTHVWGQFGSVSGMDRRLHSICRFISDNPAFEGGLRDLAHRFGVSERTLRRMAREQLGCSVSEWRSKCRVLEAARLLQMGVPIGRVGEQVGFRSESAFFAAFKRMIGSTPRRFCRNSETGYMTHTTHRISLE